MRNKSKKKLTIQNPDAAGIDIGATAHYVCVPEGRDKEEVKRFGVFTEDLYDLADWLKKCRVKTVAMESTGVFWIPLFQVLEKRGFEVKLVNARYVKNVPGRGKSDVQDCRWIQKLHSYGLLAGSFRPDDQICVLRSYMRQREALKKSACVHINRMQKALTQMNLQLPRVLSDITGVTGLRIIRAILDGERDPAKLAALRNHRVKSSEETICKALQGDWRLEHLFVLQQEFALYMTYQEKIEQCDQQIARYYESFETKANTQNPPPTKKIHPKGQPPFDLRETLYRITGIDLTTIPGLDVLSAQVILSEVGLDMSRWPTEKHFASWLGLSPCLKISGERVLSSQTRKVKSRASIAFRLAAFSVMRSQNAVGAFARRLKTRLGAPMAITATAHKIACIFYRTLRYGRMYVDVGVEYYDKRYRERLERSLKKRAATLGFKLVPEGALSG